VGQLACMLIRYSTPGQQMTSEKDIDSDLVAELLPFFIDDVVERLGNVEQMVVSLGIYQFRSTAQSCGSGRQDCINLTMRRSPRVNQEVLLRATFLG
jgi:hypothetical protein